MYNEENTNETEVIVNPEYDYSNIIPDKEYIKVLVRSCEEMYKRLQDLFKKDDSLDGLFKAIELLLGKEALEEIKGMKVKVADLKVIIIAIMAQVNEITYEEMEKRFQNK